MLEVVDHRWGVNRNEGSCQEVDGLSEAGVKRH